MSVTVSLCHQEPRLPGRILGEGGTLGYAYTPQLQYFQPVANSTIRRVHYPPDHYVQTYATLRSRQPPEMVIQGDFRKISGISSEMFRQIEAVEKQYDPTTATLIEAVERRGEMVVRILDPRILGRPGLDAHRKYLNASTGGQVVQFVEIIKRPGQTLGLYIREGDGLTTNEGVFISRIAMESPIYSSGILKIGDEVLAVNLVDVSRMSLDDVVIVMSIPRRLVLTIRSRMYSAQQQAQLQQQQQQQQQRNINGQSGQGIYSDDLRSAPVVVVKKELDDEIYEERDPQTGQLLRVGLKSALGMDDDYLDRPTSRLSVIRPPTRNLLRPMTHARDDTYVQIYQKAADARTRPYGLGVVGRQPRVYPRTLDNLIEEPTIYSSGYMSDGLVPRKSATLSRIPRAFSRTGRMSAMSSHHFLDDFTSGHLGRREALLRPSSALAGIIDPVTDDLLDRYTRPLSRLSLRSGTPTSNYHSLALMRRARDELQSSLSSHALAASLKNRSFIDGSASDTEAAAFLKNRSLLNNRYSRLAGANVLSDKLRTSSLPRPHNYSRRNQLNRQLLVNSRLGRPGLPFDDDSDGAASAPEAPEKPKRLLKHHKKPHPADTNYSSNEYQAWMTRTPSTSALYESINRPGSMGVGVGGVSVAAPGGVGGGGHGSNSKAVPSSALPSGLSNSSLSKIAHSAESLLDTIRMEAQKNLLADLYANRGAVAASIAANSSDQRRSSPLSNTILSSETSSPILKPLHPLRVQSSNRSVLNSTLPTSSEYLRNTTAAIPNPTPVKPSEDSRMHLLTLNPREFFKYKYEKNNPDIETNGNIDDATANGNDLSCDTPILGSTADSARTLLGYSGLLWIHLLAGRGLRATPASNPASTTASTTTTPTPGSTRPSIGLNRDLYCVIECDRVHKARTVVRSGESSFDWDEVFELDILDCKESSFLLYSWDPESKHKLCYKGIVNLISLNLSKTPVHSLALKMEPRGTLYIKMRYKEPAIAFQRSLPTPPGTSTIFGVDLEVAVKRENTGTNVPLILKRCLDEVEKRGLNVVGIYRLCGSAVRKKMLREAFEKNAWLVDLSAEHVPDINVITGETLPFFSQCFINFVHYLFTSRSPPSLFRIDQGLPTRIA